MLGETEGISEVQHLFKQRLAFPKREMPDILPVQMKEIEGIEPHGDPAAYFFRWPCELHPLLQLRKARNCAFEGHDLSVHRKGIRALSTKGVHQLRIFVIEPLLVARQQLDVVAGTQSKATHAIELGLKEPSRTRKCRITQCGEHRRNPSWFRLGGKFRQLVHFKFPGLRLSAHMLRRAGSSPRR